MNKKCTKCLKSFPATPEYFYKRKRGKFGLESRCRGCCKNINRSRYNPDKFRGYRTKLFSKHPEKKKEYYDRYNHKNPNKNSLRYRKHRLKKLYGLTVEEYNKRVEDQKGVCPICGNQKPLVVDHNHETGKVRELICGNCNSLIGHSKENMATLQNAISYLLKHNGLLIQKP